MPKTTPDPVAQLEHDHVHLTRLVDSLRDATHEVLANEREPVTLREDILEFLSLARDELYQHFDIEEREVFPYITEVFPDTAPTIDVLEQAHDRMCGVLARLERHVESGPDEFLEQFEAVVTLFARFDANFARHSREERALLRELAERLSRAQREQLAELLTRL